MQNLNRRKSVENLHLSKKINNHIIDKNSIFTSNKIKNCIKIYD